MVDGLNLVIIGSPSTFYKLMSKPNGRRTNALGGGPQHSGVLSRLGQVGRQTVDSVVCRKEATVRLLNNYVDGPRLGSGALHSLKNLRATWS
jgi:hypothetical protein